MRNWLLGQMLLMATLGVSSFIMYFALGLKYYYLLAMYACLANIIPIVGQLSSVILASTVAALDSPNKVVGVLIFYVIYAQIESGFLTPRIMKSTVDLSPLAVIIALAWVARWPECWERWWPYQPRHWCQYSRMNI